MAHEALAWLETLDPPVIAAPSARAGKPYKNYVPNNDLDAKGLADIRVPKQIRPHLFDADAALLYLWHFENDPEGHARAIVALAERLYQLGRGVDMAWATGEILGADEAIAHLEKHGNTIHHPLPGNGDLLACPAPGSLQSLIARREAMGERIRREDKGKKTQYVFTQPPKPRFRQVPYDSPPERLLFDLRDLSSRAGLFSWPLSEAVRLVKTVRDQAAARLRKAYEEAGQHGRSARVDRVFIGRNATKADKPARGSGQSGGISSRMRRIDGSAW